MFGVAIYWMRKRRDIFSLSTIENGHMDSTHGNKEYIWLQLGIGFIYKVVRISCDRSSALFIAKNHTYHSNTKTIDV